MNIVFISAEVVPFSKVGGLADVAGALPQALRATGVNVSVFTPYYSLIDAEKARISKNAVFEAEIPMGIQEGKQPLAVFEACLPGTDIPVFFFHNARYFDRRGVYTDPDTGLEFEDGAYRYIFFVKACLEFIRQGDHPCDLVHCNDSHTALLPALLHLLPEWGGAQGRAGSVLTIHNIAYQGLYPPSVLDALGLPTQMFYPLSPFEYFGKVNFLKVGLIYSDLITTVSERYAREIQDIAEYGCGLEGILHQRTADLYGVLNGVDYTQWEPRTDRFIPAPYDADHLAGKREAKRALLEAFRFKAIDLDRPVMGMVGRLVDQKGVDLLMPLLPWLARTRAYLVVLGTGLPEYHEQFQEAAAKYPHFLGVRIGFDNSLAHQIEAGSDMFLMPSRYEPCGLNQMYSLRYGTVPVVRATGGLADTVNPFDLATRRGTGFVFERYDSEAFLAQLARALLLFEDKELWTTLMRNGMAQDFSWGRAARRYVELYRKAMEKRK